ncbi:MAG: hypothetical protein Q7T66_04530 [Herminiimonas sp.]|uniref:hypothetical protein n=1 Tax=Herminiimonas sp. TaxID=1926289 RepID=UPI002726B3A8|nr:hypothetical protein [Herminiimonas sp.]MDO9419911.1 hypothetical protein [Herminiimonas sp.]
MRSTRATSAVERLKERSGNDGYAMVRTAAESFYLVDNSGGGAPVVLCEHLPLDEFVSFVKAYGPQTPRRQTKSDIAFEKQLVKKSES